ncbi:MAG: alpha/beta hydrolase [Leptolyngbyaceae cyanobacterium bins.349]|nr:alpha/beta hydrolase [Leptolyngbyaceae cyanobacterium bins.349]
MEGVELRVLIQGTGYPVLCLHGHPGTGASMAVFTQHLSTRFKTLAPDLRGYGKSQTRNDFTMTDHLLDLDRLLDRYQIDRCLILGWSLGGILAIEMALRSPQRVSGLILVATSARPWGNHPAITWQDNVLTGVASILNWLDPGRQWVIDNLGRRSLYRYLIQQHTSDAYRYLAAAALPAYLQTSQPATRALFRAIRQGYNRLADLRQIQVPCLVLAGACDRHITAASSQEMVHYLPQAQWRCYSNAAHLFPWEIPNQVLTDIDQWLQQFPQVVQADLPMD